MRADHIEAYGDVYCACCNQLPCARHGDCAALRVTELERKLATAEDKLTAANLWCGLAGCNTFEEMHAAIGELAAAREKIADAEWLLLHGDSVRDCMWMFLGSVLGPDHHDVSLWTARDYWKSIRAAREAQQ